MTSPVSVSFAETDLDALAEAPGRVAVFVPSDGRLSPSARRVNRLTKGALTRMVERGALDKLKPGDLITLAWPSGLAAEALDVVVLARNATVEESRRAGVALGRVKGDKALLVLGDPLRHPVDVLLGAVLRAYEFTTHKTAETKPAGGLTLMVGNPAAIEAAAGPVLSVAEGVFLTRDLVNEPANHLTTTEFAARIATMADLGLKISVLEEKDMAKLGMGALLSVGHGSISPSKLVVMEWQGGAKGEAPLALVGKGVIFDTGGISMKPAAGMEDMTMDMGGAGVVTGVMHILARRKAQANVVGLVGLVENMVSDRATRPGDVVTSMKGDTIEVINTDAEGRLVLADVLWYAQEKYKPRGIIDLATLTGAIIIGLGHETAGVFSNDDALCKAFLKAAEAEGEAAWRMPMGAVYDEKLASQIADMRNVGGGREAGSITAAQFLQRYIEKGVKWAHLDIAGMVWSDKDTPIWAKGATGYGVRLLDRYIADNHEG